MAGTATATTSARPGAGSYTGPYAKIINPAAFVFGIDPYVLAGVLKVESGFNPKPQHVDPSDAGIAGINLPSWPGVTRAQAETPSFAIPWAARLLAKLGLQRDSASALRAYHTGQPQPSPRGDAYVARVQAAVYELATTYPAKPGGPDVPGVPGLPDVDMPGLPDLPDVGGAVRDVLGWLEGSALKALTYVGLTGLAFALILIGLAGGLPSPAPLARLGGQGGPDRGEIPF